MAALTSRLWPALLGVVGLLGTSACSNLRQTYRAPHYDAAGAGAVKRVAVVGWAPHAEAGAGPVVAAVAADLLKLRKNYLVVGASAGYAGRWSLACTNDVQGVVLVRALQADGVGAPAPAPAPQATTQATPAAAADKVQLRLALSLLRCDDGALLYRSEAEARRPTHDADLAALTANYAAALGPDAATYAAPSFYLLQQMVRALPDPALSDAEVEEKIELGAAGAASASAPQAALARAGGR